MGHEAQPLHGSHVPDWPSPQRTSVLSPPGLWKGPREAVQNRARERVETALYREDALKRERKPAGPATLNGEAAIRVLCGLRGLASSLAPKPLLPDLAFLQMVLKMRLSVKWAGAGQAQAGTTALQMWPVTLTGLSRGAIREPRRSHPGHLVRNNVVTSRVPGGHSHRLGIGAGQLVRGRSGHGHFPKATITQLVFLIKESCVTCVSGSDRTRTLGGKQNRSLGPMDYRMRGGHRRL